MVPAHVIVNAYASAFANVWAIDKRMNFDMKYLKPKIETFNKKLLINIEAECGSCTCNCQCVCKCVCTCVGHR